MSKYNKYKKSDFIRIFEILEKSENGSRILKQAILTLQNEIDEKNQAVMDQLLEKQAEHLRIASNIMKPYSGANLNDIPESVWDQYTREVQNGAKCARQYVKMMNAEKRRWEDVL